MAKNIGLAAQLAKQAAQAAREEAQAASGQTKPVAKGWTPPALPHDFNVDTAVTKAATQVAAHYRQILAPEGLQVNVTGELQGMDSFQADLSEAQGGRLIKAYTAGDLLAMYAFQQRITGVVVDGQV